MATEKNYRYLENQLARYYDTKVLAKYDTSKFPPCSGMEASYEFWVDGTPNSVQVMLYLYRGGDYIFSFFNGEEGEEHTGNIEEGLHHITLTISKALWRFEKQFC
jgi:hypothetical protein